MRDFKHQQTMSREPASKSRTLTWTVSALAVLLLYVASWPPIEIKARG